MYRGLDSVHKFLTDIFEEDKKILEKFKVFQKTPMTLSKEEKIHHKKQQHVMFVIVISLLRIVRFVTIAMF